MLIKYCFVCQFNLIKLASSNLEKNVMNALTFESIVFTKQNSKYCIRNLKRRGD